MLTITREKAGRFKEEFGFSKAYGSYEELLAAIGY